MASLIPGYEYDIFISYRQKDNKFDGWVTEFVNQLRGQLEATFKEDVSIYFDENPDDGLLETYSVDKSLEGKLKCLILIPIISQTYCDPNSFAWKHELCAFNKLAIEDRFGRDIKLSSGNVASRILPVRIYDLDPEDKELLEKELGGVLRSIDFIYKSPGVNRPLRAIEDHPRDNLNKTYYRDQINKTANALKEIITALKRKDKNPVEITKHDFKVASALHNGMKRKIVALIVSLLVLAIPGIILIQKLVRSEKVEKSIAVLPFRNDSPSDSNKYFINGIVEEILNNLQTIKDIRVISRTSSERFRNTDKSIPEIAKELGVNYIVEGSGQKFGSSFSLSVQLIMAKPKESHLWAHSYQGNMTDNTREFFDLQRQISLSIAGELKAVITPVEDRQMHQVSTDNPVAYDYYLRGKQFYTELDYSHAVEMYSKAIEEDPNFLNALLARSLIASRIFFTRGNEYKYTGDWKGFDKLAKSDLAKAFSINPNLPEVKLAQAELHYTLDHRYDTILLDEIEDQLSNNPGFHNLRAAILRRAGNWRGSLEEWNKQILLDPLSAGGYIEAGHTYRLLRNYKEACDFYDKSLSLSLNQENIAGKFQTILLWKGNLDEALKMTESTAENKQYIEGTLLYLSRQFNRIVQTARKYEDQFDYRSRNLGLAVAYYLSSDYAMSKLFADSAIAEIELLVKDSPQDDRYYAALAFAYGFAGDKKRAMENINKAVRLKPLELDAWQGYNKELDLAKIYILTGDYDLAMDKIEYLLTKPGDLSVPFLRIDPAYDKLRSFPRFQKILTTDY